MKRKIELIFAGALALVIALSAINFKANKPSEIKAPWTMAKFNSQQIKWESCYDSFQCGSFLVPIDYQNLKMGTFRLQALRHQALNKKARIGSILVNPGGPGGSSYDFAMSANSIVSDAINEKFDVIGFDGRGIGESEPIRCLSDKEEDDFINVDGDATSLEQVEKVKSIAQSFAEKCAAKAGIKLGHLSTFETAKDMEILRNILREPKLNFLGKSYGTYLGAIYISLFPEKVGRFVLDGAVDPNISIRDQSLNQAVGFEKSLDSYLAFSKKFTKSEIQKFIENSGSNPLKNKSGRALSRSLLVTALAASLYDNVLGWRNLDVGLTNAIHKGDPDRLLTIADEYNNRDVNGHYFNNQNDIGIAINCLDWNTRDSFEEITADAENFIKASETFGKYIAYSSLPCTYWKAPPLQPNLPFESVKSSPFLIIGVTKDPATPYVWSQNLANEFPNSTLLTLNGEGHTGHNRGNRCIDSKVDAYFLTGKVPEPGISCGSGGN